jgi:hypothetical protein
LQKETRAIAAFVAFNVATIFPGVDIRRDTTVPELDDSPWSARLREQNRWASRLLAVVMQDSERRQIMYVFHFISNLCGYEVTAVIYDGLLIRSNKKGSQIMDSDTFVRGFTMDLKKADEYAYIFTDYRIHTAIKPMDDYIPVLNNPRDAAEALAGLCPRRIVYDDGEGTLLIYSDELRQWCSSTQALYKLIDSKRFYMGDYAVNLDPKAKKINPISATFPESASTGSSRTNSAPCEACSSSRTVSTNARGYLPNGGQGSPGACPAKHDTAQLFSVYARRE